MEYTSKEKEVISQIGKFFLERNLKKSDNETKLHQVYLQTREEIQDLCITRIIFTSDQSIDIYLGRPGLLIGKKGEQIDALSEYLNKKYGINKIQIREDNLFMYLIPNDWPGY
ncbi:MAG TPA: KH domain-containing protein [Bacilli bacterium]|jgi:ribosomal protein S3|nr:KH domain-containing protein [Bacilli bacterium]